MSEQLTAEVRQLGSRLYEQLNHPRCAPLSLRDGVALSTFSPKWPLSSSCWKASRTDCWPGEP